MSKDTLVDSISYNRLQSLCSYLNRDFMQNLENIKAIIEKEYDDRRVTDVFCQQFNTELYDPLFYFHYTPKTADELFSEQINYFVNNLSLINH